MFLAEKHLQFKMMQMQLIEWLYLLQFLKSIFFPSSSVFFPVCASSEQQ